MGEQLHAEPGLDEHGCKPVDVFGPILATAWCAPLSKCVPAPNGYMSGECPEQLKEVPSLDEHGCKPVAVFGPTLATAWCEPLQKCVPAASGQIGGACLDQT